MKKLLNSLIIIGLITFAFSGVGFAETSNGDKETKKIVKQKKNGKEIEVVIPTELEDIISEEIIDNMVEESGEDTFRINIEGISEEPKNGKEDKELKKENKKVKENTLIKNKGWVSPYHWYEGNDVTVNTSYSGESWGIREQLASVGEGQKYVVEKTFELEVSYSMSGTYKASVVAELESSYSTTASYTIKEGWTYEGPPEDPNYNVTRFHYTAPVYRNYNFTWEEVEGR